MAERRIYSVNVIDDDQPDANDFCGSTPFAADSPNPINGNGITIEITVVEQVVSTQVYTQTIVVQDCADCPPDYANMYALTGASDHQLMYATDGAIESSQTLLNAGSMDYNSGTQICLDAGFEVVLGAVFHAYIEGCPTATLRQESDNKVIRP